MLVDTCHWGQSTADLQVGSLAGSDPFHTLLRNGAVGGSFQRSWNERGEAVSSGASGWITGERLFAGGMVSRTFAPQTVLATL